MSDCENDEKNVNHRVFAHPFVHVVNNLKVNRFCSHCMRPASNTKTMLTCNNCHFARYCNEKCESQAWASHHQVECARLQRSFPNLPLTEVLLMARIVSRVTHLNDTDPDQADRKWHELMSHNQSIANDPEKHKTFQNIYAKTKLFVGEEEMPEESEFLIMFGRVWVNSHSVSNMVGEHIGTALDLGVSLYDHSCAPNCTLVYEGHTAILRALDTSVDVFDTSTAHIAYVEIACSRFHRRQLLRVNWYFDCECVRCSSAEDDALTAMSCTHQPCDGFALVTETDTNLHKQCVTCKQTQDTHAVQQAIDLMRAQPIRLDHVSVEQIKDWLSQAELYLHKDNIYKCRLVNALLQHEADHATYGTVQSLLHIYQLYKKVLPSKHRHRGYQLLHVVRALVRDGRRAEAVPYTQQALAIFQCCFGQLHPFSEQMRVLIRRVGLTQREAPDNELYQLIAFGNVQQS